MAENRARWLAAVGLTLAASVGLGVIACDARADRIVLRGGGRIKGKVTPDPKHPDRVLVLGERGKTPLSLSKTQVAEVVAEPGPLDEYLTRRGAAAATAEGQFELGSWCERHALPDLAVVHYEAAVGVDKTFAPAQRKLGRVPHQDRWLTADEVREAQGLVRYKGKWVTREEKDRHDALAATAAEQATWVRRIRLLREAIVFSSEDRRREAETQLLEIREPVAIGPLVKVLGGDAPHLRLLLSHVLGSIPGPEASAALVARLLDEGEADVRYATMDELQRRKEGEVTRVLAKALRSSTPEVVNRAAWGLSNLHAVSAVPNLVEALVTVRYEVVLATASGGSGEGLGISATFGSVPPTPAPGGLPLGYGGSSVGAPSLPNAPLPSSPALPAVGFGPGSAGLGLPAGGGLNASRGPVPRVVGVTFRNFEVLSALVKLTGQDFGWDVDAWKRWVRTSFNSEPTPARRVPQP